jgi:hypothetical protein
VETATLPVDQFSRRFRELSDNPGAVRSSSTVNTVDFYGKTESWIGDTFRVDGNEVVFLQRINAEGSVRIVLPAEVTAAMNRQRDRATKVVRRRGARQALATKRDRGIDPAAALRKHAARKGSRKRTGGQS